MQRRRRGSMLVADLDLRAQRCCRCAAIETQFTSRAIKRVAQQIVVAADDHALRRRLGRDHVQRLAGRDAEPAALSDREMVHARVLAEPAPVADRQFRRESSRAIDPLLLEDTRR